MARVRFGDVVKEIKINIDRATDNHEFYIAGEHMETENIHLTKRGRFEGSDVGPAFIRLFRPGQVLYGSRRTYLKKVAVADFEGITSNTTFVLETKDQSVMMQELLPFIMLTDSFTEYAIRNSKGSTNPYILFSDLCAYEFELPAIEKQHILATRLLACDNVKEAYKRLLTATDELVKSQFVEMFGENKAGCRYLKLEDCCTKITGGKTPSMSHPEFYGGDIPFIKSGDVKESTVSKGVLWLTEEAITKGGASLLPKDSIIVVIRSAALRHEFHVAVTEVPVVINQDLKAFQPKPEFMPIYLQWAIMSHESSLLGKVQTVLTSHIEMSDLLSIPVMVADLEQQQAFCDFKQQADKSKFAAQQALADLTATQKALMRQYLG